MIPVRRGPVRRRLGMAYYTGRRYLLWASGKYRFAQARETAASLPYIHASHATPLLRQLQGVDMCYQYNKITNLRLAVQHLDGLLLRPGETMSYWKLIGRPTYKKGYLDGLVLSCGQFGHGVGGGLCQLSNLIFWMTMHTPLTVDERYRHSHDVFPDSGRTQPFGSGATCAYPHRDLMITNDTDRTFRGPGTATMSPMSATGWWSGTMRSGRSFSAATAGTTGFTGRPSTRTGRCCARS